MVIMRILIYDRYPILSAFIRKMIEEELPQSRVFTTACPLKDESSLKSHYNVVVLTISKEDTIGFNLSFIKETSVTYPGSRLLVFDIGSPSYREMPLYFREGGWGYISLSNSADNIKTCLNKLYEGKKFIPYEGVEWILNNHKNVFSVSAKNRIEYRPFTSSELCVAKALIRGKKVTDIARDSDRKVSTISTLKRKLMAKVGVDNIIELRTIMESIGETPF